MQGLVSVIIPAYGREEQLKDAVQSVLQQTYSDLEILIVDDGTPIPLTFIDPRVTVLRHETNKGAAAARNTGVRAAKGDWIAFLDSDDTWRPDKISKQLAALDNKDEKTAGSCGFSITGETVQQDSHLVPMPSSSPHDFYAGCWFNPGSTLLIKKKTFEHFGFFDETLRRLEDYEWFLRFAPGGGSLIVACECLADIHVGKRPALADINIALHNIMKRHGARMAAPERRIFRAYAALERASACRREKDYSRMMYWLYTSFIRQPRLRLHLRNFWQMGA